MSEIRMIKKYPNRRLYDTAISSYITLEDVKRLVLENISIQVIDARTKNDITHNTLLQIIIEQEETGPSIFTTAVLQEMIRFYGSNMQTIVSRIFEQTTQFFSKQQNLVNQGATEGLQESMQQDPFALISDLTRKDAESWKQIQEQWVMALKAPQKSTVSQTPEAEPLAQGYAQESK